MASWTCVQNGFRTPDSSARNQSLNRLRSPGHHTHIKHKIWYNTIKYNAIQWSRFQESLWFGVLLLGTYVVSNEMKRERIFELNSSKISWVLSTVGFLVRMLTVTEKERERVLWGGGIILFVAVWFRIHQLVTNCLCRIVTTSTPHTISEAPPLRVQPCHFNSLLLLPWH